MDALLGAMEPTIHRLSILPSVTARRKPHGGIFQGSSMYFFWGQVTHPSPARQCPAFPGGKVPSECEADEGADFRLLCRCGPPGRHTVGKVTF